MGRIAYVNGRYLSHDEAAVHVEDRGYQFADGVYEVVALRRGRFVDLEAHMDRLERSLGELRIRPPMGRAALANVLREVRRRNRLRDGLVYLQATRGVARRDHPFPAAARTALVVTAARRGPPDPSLLEEGRKAVTVPDNRWGRCDIKSVSLLPNVLAKQAAREAGAFEALFVDADGMVTEGSSTNAWIVTPEGELVTRALDHGILAGITRASLSALARDLGLALVERRFSVEELRRAREAFVTSTTACVTPLVQVDDAVVGNGRPGSVATGLAEAYENHMAGAGATA